MPKRRGGGGIRHLPTLVALAILILLASSNAWGVPPPIRWEDFPAHQIRTTQGSFFLDLDIQLARDETSIYFRAWFDYPLTPNDPELVYFGVDFDLSGRGQPMSAGNEMILVSVRSPTGSPANHSSYYVEQTEKDPVPSPENIVSVDSFEIAQSSYEIEFHRPLLTSDPVHSYQFTTNSSVRVAFAVGEWGIGRAHSYTSMGYIITTTSEEVLLTAPSPPAFQLVLSKEFARSLGRAVLITTSLLIGIHIFRRRVWSPKKYHPWLKNRRRVEVVRHHLPARITHFIHLGLLLIFVFTGWSMLMARPLFGEWTLIVHMIAAFMVIINIPLHFLLLKKTGEWKSLVRITRDDISVALKLSLNFLGLSKEYPEHVTYNPVRGEYYKGRKYCSFQKFLLWGDTLFFALMALTGFALYYPGELDWLLGVFGGRGATLAVHDLLFYLLSSTVLGHFYFSVVPANWPRLGSIVSGKTSVPTHEL